MTIKIAQRLKPFSHTPGISAVVPGSCIEVHVFPALLELWDLSNLIPAKLDEVSLNINGPVEDFTAVLDLEKNVVRVWGNTPAGFFRYHLKGLSSNSVGVFIEKSPNGGLKFSSTTHLQLIETKGRQNSPSTNFERLSLGNHKLQDWDRVVSREDLTEILPFWHRAGLVADLKNEPLSNFGTGYLLQQCEEAIHCGATTELKSKFISAFKACFEGILCPRLNDNKHLGFDFPPIPNGVNASSMQLLSRGSRLIRSMFLQAHGKEVKILPALAPEFHSGRFIQAALENIGVLDMEWSKKSIRIAMLHAQANGEVNFLFQRHLKSFRLREISKHTQDRGHIVNCGDPIVIKAGCQYCFDNFKQ